MGLIRKTALFLELKILRFTSMSNSAIDQVMELQQAEIAKALKGNVPLQFLLAVTPSLGPCGHFRSSDGVTASTNCKGSEKKRSFAISACYNSIT